MSWELWLDIFFIDFLKNIFFALIIPTVGLVLVYKDQHCPSYFWLNLGIMLVRVWQMDWLFIVAICFYLIIRNQLPICKSQDSIAINFIVLYVLSQDHRHVWVYLFCLLCTIVQGCLYALLLFMDRQAQEREKAVLLHRQLHELENLKVAADLFALSKGAAQTTNLNDLYPLLQEYQKDCEQYFINTKWIIELSELPLAPVDCVSLFGNCLNNVLLHGQDYVHFQCDMQGEKIVLLVRNGVKKQLKKEVSIKHGHGLTIIKQLVNDYHGTIDICQNEDEFSLLILFDKNVGHK